MVRVSSGLTLDELATRAGTSAPTLSDYERGTKEPRLSTVRRILEAAGHDLRLTVEPRGTTPAMTRKDRRSLALHRAVAAKLIADPDRLLSLARDNLDRLRAVHDDGSADRYFAAWAALLDGPLDALLEVLTSERQHARDLRQTSPFAGALADVERQRILSVS